MCLNLSARRHKVSRVAHRDAGAHIVKRKYVYDFDTTLPFPCLAERYAREALDPLYSYMSASAILQSHLVRRFRLIPASVFLRYFASDRSHMVRQHF